MGIVSILNKLKLIETLSKEENPNHLELEVLFSGIKTVLERAIAQFKMKKNVIQLWIKSRKNFPKHNIFSKIRER